MQVGKKILYKDGIFNVGYFLDFFVYVNESKRLRIQKTEQGRMSMI